MTPIERIKALLATRWPLCPDSAVLRALRNAAPALIEFVDLSVAMERAKWIGFGGTGEPTYVQVRNNWLAALARLTKDEEA